MSTEEAKEYVDVVVETLVDWKILPERTFLAMTETQRERLAELVVFKSEELAE